MEEKNNQVEEIQDEELEGATGGTNVARSNVARSNVARSNVARSNVARSNVARSLHAQLEADDEGEDTMPGGILSRCPLCLKPLAFCTCRKK